MADKKRHLCSLAVLESDFGRSALSILEDAARGEITVLFHGSYRLSDNSKWLRDYFPINAKALLRVIREIGLKQAFDEELDFDYQAGSKIFSQGMPSMEGSTRALPGLIRLKENLFVDLEQSDITSYRDKGKSSPEGKKLKSPIQYPVPADAPWSQVKIVVETTESLSIRSIGQNKKTFTYSDLGFKGKKDGRSDRLWTLLLKFAVGKGEIPANAARIEKIKTDIGTLRKRLQAITGISETPITYDKKIAAYKTEFAISNQIPKQALRDFSKPDDMDDE